MKYKILRINVGTEKWLQSLYSVFEPVMTKDESFGSVDNSGARQQLMLNVCPTPDGFMTPQYMHSIPSTLTQIPNALTQIPNPQMQFVPRSAASTPPDDTCDTQGSVVSSVEYISNRVETLLIPGGDDECDECDGVTEKVKAVSLCGTEEKVAPPSEPAAVTKDTKQQRKLTYGCIKSDEFMENIFF